MSLFPKFRMILPAMHRARHFPDFWPNAERFFPSLWDSFHSPWHVKPNAETRFSYVEFVETVGGKQRQVNKEGSKEETSRGGLSHEASETSDKFKVSFDVAKFKPEEITVRTEDGELLVEGKQEVKTDDGYSTRQFFRSYSLPRNVDRDSFQSRLSKDGVLSIEAKKLQQPVSNDYIKIEKED